MLDLNLCSINSEKQELQNPLFRVSIKAVYSHFEQFFDDKLEGMIIGVSYEQLFV
jgi:hypothetical protein